MDKHYETVCFLADNNPDTVIIAIDASYKVIYPNMLICRLE